MAFRVPKNTIKEIILILVPAVIAAFAVNAFSPKGIAFLGDWDLSQGVITAKPRDDVVFHDLEIDEVFAVKELYDSGEAIFVDARVYEDYMEGRIKGAESLPAYQFEELIVDFKKDHPIHKLLITYCSGRECDDSHMLAQCLLDEGYTDVIVFIDGYPAWKDKGFPIEP